MLATDPSEFKDVIKTLKTCNANKIFQWITESLKLIYTAEGPPVYNNYEPFKTLGVSDEACMVTTVIVQWILRFMCKKLMQLMTPEAVILKRK